MSFQSVLQNGFKAFRVFGIEVRIHLFLAIWILADILRALEQDYDLPNMLMASGMLFGIVLLHEFGHCFAGRKVGGSSDRILMWPFGGLAFVAAPMRPTPQLIVAVGGPLVNVLILLALAPYIFFGDGIFGSYFLRLAPPGLYDDPLSMLFAINLDLLMFNLIPAFPMDGGRVLQCCLWYKMGYRRATIVTVIVARFFLALMLVGGLYIYAVSGSMLLGLMAVFLFFSAEREKKMAEHGAVHEEGGMFGGGASMAFDAEPKRSWFQRWRARREGVRREREQRVRREMRERVDELLEKVSREGLPSLTSKERRFLEEASEQYRDR